MDDARIEAPRVDDDLLERRMEQVERCAEALAAGTSMSAFCRSEHVAPGTVRAWAERLGVDLPERGRANDGDADGWVAVELPAAQAGPAPIEVEIAGALVRVPAGSDRADVECVLGALAAIR